MLRIMGCGALPVCGSMIHPSTMVPSLLGKWIRSAVLRSTSLSNFPLKSLRRVSPLASILAQNASVGCAGSCAVYAILSNASSVVFQRAKAVVLCANGSETPKLLLNSATNGFEHGLANSSGVVGRYLMFNKGGGAQARFEHPLNEYKGANVTRVIHDFYDSDPKRGFYGGGGFDARSHRRLDRAVE